MDRISVGEEAARRPYSWNDFYTKYLDDLHPINLAVQDMLRMQGQAGKLTPGKRLPALQDPYVLARLSRGSIGKANAMLESGVLDWRTSQPVTSGLRDILQPVEAVGKLDVLRTFLAARHAMDLQARGLKIPFEVADAQAALTLRRGRADPVISEAAAGIDAYQAALRKYVMDSGLWSAEQVRAMEKLNPNYVPFYRFIEEPRPFMSYPAGPAVGGRRFANLPSGTRKAKGGETLPLADPLENIMRNTYSLVQLADRHAVSNQLIRMAENTPGQEIVRPIKPPTRRVDASPEMARAFREQGIEITPEQAAEFSTTYRPAQTLGEGVIWAWQEGKRKFFQVDPELHLGRESTNSFVQMLSAPARILRAGATLSPRFIARNPFRDQFTAAVFSNYGFKPGYDLFRGIFHAATRDRLYQDFRRAGGEHATLVRTTAAERRGLQRTLDDLVRQDSMLADAWRTAKGPKGWLEGLRVLSSTMEQASRAREFQRALAQTGDPRTAAFASREVTLDFARMGTNIRVLNQIIPFFNANIQGMDKLVRVFRDNPQKASALAMAYITMPTLALYAINHDDPIYNELTEARRDMFWNVPIMKFNDNMGRLERTGEFLSVPKPFDAGLIFGAAAERTARWLKDNDPEAWDQFAGTLLESFVPGVLPTAIAPPIEAVTNFSFFRRRPIVPEREQDLLPAEQAGPLQGETVRAIGQAFGVSPRKVEALVRGYTGGLGEGALATTDLILDKLNISEGPIEPRTPLERTPLVGPMIGQFLVREPTISSRSVETFYRNWESVGAVMNTVRAQIREARGTDASNLARGSQTEMAAYPIFQEASTAMNRIMRAIRLVRANKNIEREDREERIRMLGRVYRTIAGNANEAYNKLKFHLEAQAPQPQPSSPGVTVTPLLDMPESGRERAPAPLGATQAPITVPSGR
jgi:hypothetical protein